MGRPERRPSSIAVDVALDAVDDHFERDQILAALEHDEISIFFARLNELLVHGLDRCKILAKHGIEASPALCNVAADAADKADISVRIHKDLDIHLIAQGVVLEDQDTLDQNDLARLDRNGFARAGIGRIVVDGHSMLCPAFSSFKLPIIMSVSKASG